MSQTARMDINDLAPNLILTDGRILKGAIEAGKLADLAVLDRDYFVVPEEQIKDVKATMTVVGGQVVWKA